MQSIDEDDTRSTHWASKTKMKYSLPLPSVVLPGWDWSLVFHKFGLNWTPALKRHLLQEKSASSTAKARNTYFPKLIWSLLPLQSSGFFESQRDELELLFLKRNLRKMDSSRDIARKDRVCDQQSKSIGLTGVFKPDQIDAQVNFLFRFWETQRKSALKY